MNKVKRLHRKGPFSKKWKHKQNFTKNMDGIELPYRESIRRIYKKNSTSSFFDYRDGLDFTPVWCFLEERIGQNWNDLYSDIISKTRPKYRWCLENFLKWQIVPVTYENYLPYRANFGSTRLVLYDFFVDWNNKLRCYQTKEELYNIAIKLERRDKLIQLKENLNEE